MMDIFDHEGVFIYIDDIIIVAKTFDEFSSRIKFVLERAHLYRVNLGLHKCKFITKNHPITILGCEYIDNTRRIDSKRVEARVNIPTPTTIKEVRSFVGSINYIKDFIADASDLLAPIIALVKNKARTVHWTPQLQSNFDEIKRG
ncbi:hypothetical protein GEMRC1_013088 [Eukaryota sp. GEM-RC1]